MSAERLLSLLREVTREIIDREQEVAVAFSGGLDSSVIASVAGEMSKVTCYTSAVQGSLDSNEAGCVAEREGFRLEMLSLTRESIERHVQRASQALGTSNPTEIAYTIPLLRVVEGCRENLVLAGSGADELFAGYAKYEGSPDLRTLMDRDLAKMLDETRRLGDAIAPKNLGLPFASQRVVSFATSLPMEDKLGPRGRKLVLREVGRLLGLEAHNRPKKAAQYSSGVLKEMRRLAREEHMDLGEWTREASASARRMP